ncbi:MAG TPA: TraR/DksA C4-type zinc finger protein [Thermoclostridium caenicola]|uniref:Transcriptional regulator, TraR/DksA family n=2 Tax=Thermoclostridium caenicola TaxID=659425 RepID=A0A1M6JC87_9FIRM|nr:TraR/DksA C4-type zinc finger protein [Thermoclostridium caenicola]SHJ44234.1 transcriptional regulator, TraR/DksA family [Thermoclostridium caenicola]HOK42395.1 TraR/DksA C4-type zinc finger protein [Thermoclostridium caenicola]HOL83851.1 TraR/DksA C4-type zinc finger protein [Thermoclostridium caenicola]
MRKDKMRHYKFLLDQHRENREEIIEDMEGLRMGEYDSFHLDELSGYDNHPAEIASELFDIEHYMALKKLQMEEVKNIERAERKIEEGTYGLCENCGKEIDRRRLELLPQARLCIDCARKEDEEIISTKEQTMKRRPAEEQVLDAAEMNRDGVRNEALDDLMHYGSSTDIE